MLWIKLVHRSTTYHRYVGGVQGIRSVAAAVHVASA